MPTYNYGRYLPEAIESVLRQSYTDFEFLIVDDCSFDDSAHIIKHYADKDERIIYSSNSSNVGMVNNWNLCLQRSRGMYIKFLFADDILSSTNALKQMVSVLDSNDAISLVASARNIIDECSRIKKILSEYHGKTEYKGTEIIMDCLIDQKNKIGEPSAVMFRRKNVTRGFDSRYRQAVDLEMWFHLLEQGDFAYLNEPLASFREHSEQQTVFNAKNLKLSEEPFLLLKDYADKPYIKLSRVMRRYMFYVPVYGIWKQYKKRDISGKIMIEMLKSKMGIFKFFVFYPFFKIFRNYFKIRQQRF